MVDLKLIIGDAKESLAQIADGSVNCCITSPPYFRQRNYGVDGQIGIEESPEQFVAQMVDVFRGVWRTLRSDGALWLNLGDSYSSNNSTGSGGGQSLAALADRYAPNKNPRNPNRQDNGSVVHAVKRTPEGIKPKNLIGIPWMVAFALRDDGWYLRQWIPWVKRNSLPESVTDRPASACETIFLLSKSERYYYDHEAVKLPSSMSFINDRRWETGSTDVNEKNGYAEANAQNPKRLHRMFDKQRGHSRKHAGFNERWYHMTKEEQCSGWRSTRNSDWFFEGLLLNEFGDPLALQVNPAPFSGNHYATYPPALVRPFVLAGCPRGGMVLDPFAGSGTTGMVALRLGRNATLIELNPEYEDMIRQRCCVTPELPV